MKHGPRPAAPRSNHLTLLKIARTDVAQPVSATATYVAHGDCPTPTLPPPPPADHNAELRESPPGTGGGGGGLKFGSYETDGVGAANGLAGSANGLAAWAGAAAAPAPAVGAAADGLGGGVGGASGAAALRLLNDWRCDPG